jgi:hypothetical protein
MQDSQSCGRGSIPLRATLHSTHILVGVLCGYGRLVKWYHDCLTHSYWGFESLIVYCADRLTILRHRDSVQCFYVVWYLVVLGTTLSVTHCLVGELADPPDSESGTWRFDPSLSSKARMKVQGSSMGASPCIPVRLWSGHFLASFRDRLMVRRQTLNLSIGVRISVPKRTGRKH